MKAEMKEKEIPALPDLFTWSEDGVHLISARCRSCNTYFFPHYHEQHRPGCSRERVENQLLSREGMLASYTIQYYLPPPPFKTEKNIAPYVIGLVEFPEGLQVTGIVIDCPFDRLKIGQRMETTTFTLNQDVEGNNMVTWAFRPVK